MKKVIFTVLPATIFYFGGCFVAIGRLRRQGIMLAFAAVFLLSFPAQRALSQGNNYEGPIGVTGIFNGNVTTGCSYDPLTHSAHREVTDIVVPESIGKYPLKMTRYYNSRQQYYAQNAIGLGPGWAHEYSWLLYTGGYKVVSPHGNVYDFHCGPPIGVSEGWDDGVQGPHPNGGTWRLADGGKVHFFNGSQVDYIEDPHGLRTTIEYQNGRRWRVTEPGGRCLIFTYGSAQDPDETLLLTKVEAYDYSGGHRIDWVSYVYRPYNPIDPLPQGRQPKMMLKTVTYSDGTSATYDYTYDNVREDSQHGTYKMYPLLQRCDDVRYGGPMRTIWYDYQNNGPHGAIMDEKYPGVGVVSSISPEVPTGGGDLPETFIETRGDGPSRTFTYTPFHHNTENICDDYENNTPPQQLLKTYTDFQGHTTWIRYDPLTSYVTSVTDARGTGEGDPNHTTSYTRGPAPPQGIGQITRITHPGGAHIDYSYTGTNGGPWYVMTIIDERGNKTIHTRDTRHRITQTDYIDANNNNVLLARETFSYCDLADSQCSNNPLEQLKTHRLRNGAYVHYRYDGRGVLIDKWEPTWNATAVDTDPKSHYDYYTAADGSYTAADGQLVYPWVDRVKTKTLPANYPSNYQATETYEHDRVLGANGITDVNGAARPGRALVTKITHADATFQRFAYDAYGNKRWEDNELRNATTYSYDEYNRLLNVTRPLNGITNYTYNPSNGSGSRLSHTTSNPDTVTVRTSAQSSITTRNVYDENFRKTSATAADGTASAATTWFHYDPVGNQDYVTDPRGAGPNDPQYTTTTDYDNRNRKWHVWDAQDHRTMFTYDNANNITRIDHPDGGWETKTYDGLNQLLTHTVLKSIGITILTQFQYYPYNVQSASLLKKVIDGENHTSQFEYDPSGLKTKLTYHDGSYRTWAYDDAHNLKNRTTVWRETQNFAYDNRNRKIGEWWDGWPADGEWRAFGYDAASHLTLATNGTGAYWTNFIADVRRSYDDAGRLTQDQQTIYDVNGVPITTKNVNYPTYDDDGKLTRMFVDSASPAYDYTFSYDSMGRFEKIFATGQGNPYFQYHYDSASNETQRDNVFNGVLQIYPRDNLNRMQYLDLKKSGNTLGHEGYGYDEMSRLQSVIREDNRQDWFTYYKDGELNIATYGAAPTATPTPPPTATPAPTATPPPGQVATPTFNPDGADYVACANSYIFNVIISTTTSGARIRWTIDGSHWNDMANGQMATFTVAANQTKTLQAYAYKSGMNNSNVHSADYTFERECGGQASPATYPLDNAGNLPGAPDLVGTYTYTLDKAGNRTSVNGTTYTPNTINQYTSVGGSPVTNGHDHEIQIYGGFTYGYMRDQELTRISASGLTYDVAYDALGRCVKRTFTTNNSTTSTYYIYDGDKPILEYNANNGLVGFNLYGKGIDEIIQRGAYGTDNQWHWYFPQQDHEGSVTDLTDSTGAIIERYRYDAFGAPSIYAPNWTLRTGSSYNNRFLFTGREYAGAWIYEYRARVYHSGLGRFMSEDPKGFDAGDYNLFRYCHNDPIDVTDPMGLAGDAGGGAAIDTPSLERLTYWSNARDRMAKWADSSNNFQGTFAQFAAGQGLSMGQVRSIAGHEVRRATPVRNIGVFNPNSHAITFFMKDGKVFSYPAGNNASNPRGDPFTVGSHGPFPHGVIWNVDHVERYSPNDDGWTDYGPAFFKIGDPGTIAYRRGTGLHASTDSPFSTTNGCIRISNDSMRSLLGNLDATHQKLEQVYGYPPAH